MNKKLFLEINSKQNKPSVDFEIISKVSFYNDRFKRKVKRVSFKLKHNLNEITDLFTVNREINEFFQKTIDYLTKEAKTDDLISVCIGNKELSKPIYVPPNKKKDFDIKFIFERIERFSQSFKDFLFDGELDIEVFITENIHGMGFTIRKCPKTLKIISHKKRSVIKILNQDNSCGMRALFVSKYYNDNSRDENWTRIIKNKFNMQINGARIMAKKFKINLNDPISRDDWQKIQNELTDYQIRIIDARNKQNLIFDGEMREKKLYIEYYDEHYNSIINIKGYMGRKFYCHNCHVGYDKIYKHKCKNHCIKCYNNCKSNINGKIFCVKCNITFNNVICFDSHRENRICEFVKKCANCKLKYKSYYNHRCFEYFCMNCNSKYTDQPHFCYMHKKDLKKLEQEDSVNKIIVSFDIESDLSSQQHRPMLLCYKTTCDKCYATENVDLCEICQIKGELNYFFGYDCCQKFVNYLFINLAKKAEENNSQVYAFAHNGRRYDMHFILRKIYNSNFANPEIIKDANNILFLRLGNVRIIDSLSLFQCPLDKLPKAFGLNISLKKGIFPFLFIKKENFNYEGPIPAKEFFMPQHMKMDKHKDFNKWYDEEISKNKLWNFKNEIIDYCNNDVEILLASIQKYRKESIFTNGIDPITRNFTLASASFEIFQTKFLPDRGIAITPASGCYTSSKITSIISNCWLDWIQKFEKSEIKREYRIGKYWADGFCKITNTVYEFNGCFWHGCPCVHKYNREKKTIEKKFKNISFRICADDAFRKTLKKENYYKFLGFKVKSLWGCEIKKIMKDNPEFANYIENRKIYYQKLEIVGPINIRESLHGGRTNNFKFYHVAEDDEEIKHLDVNSLYPFVQFSYKYPIDHPKVIQEDFDFSLPYFGFVKCEIEPPNNLYIPVLPQNINGNLVYTLCHHCAKNKINICNCDDRSMIGTWTTVELKFALERGYKLKNIFQVYHYENVSDELFKDFIKMCIKGKQQASGWPKNCETHEMKMNYINDFFTKTGIELEFDSIGVNDAIRQICKLNVNTNWGKLCQRPDLPKYTFVQTYDDLWKFETNENIEIESETMLTDDTLFIVWRNKILKNEKNSKYNVAIGSFVTSYARLELLKWMEKVEKIRKGSLLYFDTDSIKYVRKLTDDKIETENTLGGLCDEIEKEYGEKAKCTKFAALAPKNYAYEISLPNGKTISHIKAKGVRLTKAALDVITFEKIFSMAIDFPMNQNSKKLYVEQVQWNINTHSMISTRTFAKEYKALCKKRVILGNATVPYGFEIKNFQ